MNRADLVAPGGMPLVWGVRLLGHKNATRPYGPDLTPIALERTAAEGLPARFYGGAPHFLERLLRVLTQRFPKLPVVCVFSPSFRPLTFEQDRRVVLEISRSGVRVHSIGLNTPKRDPWMCEHRGRVRAVTLGVGAAVDFLAGAEPRAPRWVMNAGLEWLFRLATGPRRLWKR